jgi:hypothetical protein
MWKRARVLTKEDKKMSSLLTITTTLGELVRRYQVCREVWPECTVMGKKSQQAGFELELLGSNEGVAMGRLLAAA